jgi:hypothetical protein
MPGSFSLIWGKLAAEPGLVYVRPFRRTGADP